MCLNHNFVSICSRASGILIPQPVHTKLIMVRTDLHQQSKCGLNVHIHAAFTALNVHLCRNYVVAKWQQFKLHSNLTSLYFHNLTLKNVFIELNQSMYGIVLCRCRVQRRITTLEQLLSGQLQPKPYTNGLLHSQHVHAA